MAHRLACWRRRKRGTNDTALEFGNVPGHGWWFCLQPSGKSMKPNKFMKSMKIQIGRSMKSMKSRDKKKERNLFFSIPTLHTSSGLSVTQGLNMASTCVKVPPLGAFIWFQYLKIPPGTSQQFPIFIHLVSKTSPLASKQLFACISTWFQCLSFPPCLSTTSCAHLSGFNT